MTTIGSMIAASADLGIAYTERLLTGITPGQFARFASIGDTVIESNHPAFICGHLSLYACRIVDGVGGDGSAIAPSEKYVELFSKDAKCVDDPAGSIYPAMDEITSKLLAGYRAAKAALEAADDDVFRTENPNEAMRGRFPSNGAMIGFYVGGHYMLHIGQLSAWRRAIGLGPA